MSNPQVPASPFVDSDARSYFASVEQETHSNRSSATFMKSSRPNSLEIAIREAFKNSNSECDVNPSFLESIEQLERQSACEFMLCGFVIEENSENCEVPGDEEMKP